MLRISRPVPFAVEAADLSLRHDLPMADALIYAVALTRSATLVTADAHFEGIDAVQYVAGEDAFAGPTYQSAPEGVLPA